MLEIDNQADGSKDFKIGLPAAGGKLVAALPEAIKDVKVEAPGECVLGETATVRISVIGESGRPINGSLPLRVDIDDAWGRRTEWSRFTTTRRASDGVCEFTFVPAINDLPGQWRIHVTDLVGDNRAEASVSVVERTTQP
jgi:hypothetical protein